MARQAVSLSQFPGGQMDWRMRNVHLALPEGGNAMSQTKDIRDAVERELGYDPLVDDSDITVKNINGGVALNGTVPSPRPAPVVRAARRPSATWSRSTNACHWARR
jgi:hypothetical protein